MSRQPYIRPLPKTSWYLNNARYRRYMLREVTCLLVGFYSFLAIWALAALSRGSADHWNAFLQTQQNTGMIVFHAVALIYYLIYMTFDWFKLAPKAMAIQLGENKLSDRTIIFGHYAAWFAVTLFVFWLVGVF
jgi:fumarate reductase subunit C